MSAAPLILLADLSGAAKLKLALVGAGERPTTHSTFPCNSIDSLDAAIGIFLADHGNPNLFGAAIAACGWEKSGGLAMPNHQFEIKRTWLQERLNIQRVNLVNDCVATALAVPHLHIHERTKLSGPDGVPGQNTALIGVSDGLGTAAIVSELDQYTVLPCEGGHSDLPVTSDRELQVRTFLADKYGHVSRERAVSFSGLVDTYQALAPSTREAPAIVTAREVVAHALTGDPVAMEAVDLTVKFLGALASDVTLITGARGGIYLYGAYLRLLGDLFNVDAFTDRFRDKGRLTSYVEEVPVYVIATDDPELIGLSTLFDG